MAPRERVESVQAMRGVAAAGVVILHAREAIDRQGFIDHPLGSETSIGDLANLGAVGVDLFFVISGFVMALSVERMAGPRDALRFLQGRVARIVPMFWLLSLPMVAWWLAKGAPLVSLNALNSLTFVPLHLGPYAFPFHGVGWTLSFEFLFYGLVAALVAVRRLYLLPALLFALPWLPLGDHPWALVRWLTNPILAEFGFGVGAFLLWRADALSQLRRALAVGAVCAVAILAVAHATQPPAILTPNGVTHGGLGATRALLIGLPCFALFLWALPKRAGWPLVALGEASYSLYLVHPPVMVAAGYLLPRSTSGDLAFALLLAASVGAGFAAFHWLEDPIRLRLAARRDRPRTAYEATPVSSQ